MDRELDLRFTPMFIAQMMPVPGRGRDIRWETDIDGLTLWCDGCKYTVSKHELFDALRQAHGDQTMAMRMLFPFLYPPPEPKETIEKNACPYCRKQHIVDKMGACISCGAPRYRPLAQW